MIGVYVRVSTVGQNVAGQKREIQRWLDGNEMSDARWFIDKASGDDLKRPAFEDLEAAVFAGEIRTVFLRVDGISVTVFRRSLYRRGIGRRVDLGADVGLVAVTR